MFDWSDFPFFLALVEEGSALAAARRLRTNQTTVGRRIDRLEQALNLQLFERTTRGYVLTPNGAAFVDLAEKMARVAGEIETRSSSMMREIAGTIRFSGNVTTMRIYGLPLMEQFRECHPGVAFEVDTQTRQVSLEKGEADIAMRSSDEVVGETLIARKIDEQPWAFYCSNAYADTHGAPRDLGDFATHNLLMYDDALIAKIRCLSWLWSKLPEDRIAFRVDSTPGMSGALRTGAGVGVLPRVVGDDIDDLHHCFGLPELVTPIWIVASKESYSVPLVRAFLNFFSANFAQVRRSYDK